MFERIINIFQDNRAEIERWAAIVLLGSVLLFGLADCMGFFGGACTCPR